MSALVRARATTTGDDARLRRKSALALGASAATLAALISAAPARAETTVSGGSSAVATSTAASGAADDIVQTGTLSVTSGAAITLDSDNSVTNSGTVQFQDRAHRRVQFDGATIGADVPDAHGAALGQGPVT